MGHLENFMANIDKTWYEWPLGQMLSLFNQVGGSASLGTLKMAQG